MTTTVIVKAHCAKEKEVHVSVNGTVERVIHDGETTEIYAYDDREIQVREVVKQTAEAA